MKALVLVASAIAFTTVDALAEEFVCRNQEFEIACGRGRCERSEGFTPSSVSLDTRTRRLSLCMYSMCLEGKADQLLVSSVNAGRKLGRRWRGPPAEN